MLSSRSRRGGGGNDRKSLLQEQQEIESDLFQQLQRISQGGMMRQFFTGNSSICSDCIRPIYEKLTGQSYVEDFPMHLKNIIYPDHHFPAILKTLLDVQNTVTIFSLIGRIPSQRPPVSILHTFLVMNRNGKKKIFQCFVNSYRIEQWLHGDFIPRYKTLYRSLLPPQVNQKVRTIVTKYGGSRFLSKTDVNAFIAGLSTLCSDRRKQVINDIGDSLFGGTLILPQDQVPDTLVMGYHQTALDIDPDYKRIQSCPIRVLRKMDQISNRIFHA